MTAGKCKSTLLKIHKSPPPSLIQPYLHTSPVYYKRVPWNFQTCLSVPVPPWSSSLSNNCRWQLPKKNPYFKYSKCLSPPSSQQTTFADHTIIQRKRVLKRVRVPLHPPIKIVDFTSILGKSALKYLVIILQQPCQGTNVRKRNIPTWNILSISPIPPLPRATCIQKVEYKNREKGCFFKERHVPHRPCLGCQKQQKWRKRVCFLRPINNMR